MKASTVSSSTLFDQVLNPSKRLNASFGLSLAAIEQGNLDLLKSCFNAIFSKDPDAKSFYANLRKCTSIAQAEVHLMYIYGIQTKAQLPPKFRSGLRQLLTLLLSEQLAFLQAKAVEVQTQTTNLKQLLSQ